MVARSVASDCWYLVKPLAAFPQALHISGETAARIAGIVNHVCEETDNEADSADPLGITEGDIMKVCLLVQNIIEQVETQQSQVVEQKRVPLGFAA